MALRMPARPALFNSVLSALQRVAPVELAAKWDNVGLLVDTVRTSFPDPFVVFLTNDLTEKVVDEAASKGSHLIVTYHPTPFRGVKKVVRKDPVGRVMLKCMMHGMAVYATHTSLDSVPGGVNDWLIQGLGSGTCVPAVPDRDSGIDGAGMGRVMTLASAGGAAVERGSTADGAGASAGAGAGAGGAGAGAAAAVGVTTLADVLERTKRHLGLPHVRMAVAMGLLATEKATAASVAKAAAATPVSTIAVCAGSGASVLAGVKADVWVTGEMSHHEVLKANADGISVILTDHSNTERGFLPVMKEKLASAVEEEAPGARVQILLTEVDNDPLIVV